MDENMFKELYLGEWKIEGEASNCKSESTTTVNDVRNAWFNPYTKTNEVDYSYIDKVSQSIKEELDARVIDNIISNAQHIDWSAVQVTPAECINLNITIDPFVSPTTGNSSVRKMEENGEYNGSWDDCTVDGDGVFTDEDIDTRNLTDAELDDVLHDLFGDEIIDTIINNKDQLRQDIKRTGGSQSDLDELDRVIESAKRVRQGNRNEAPDTQNVREAFDYAMDILK